MKTAEIETVYQIIETAIKSEPYPETARCAAVKAEHVLKALEERGYQIQFKLPPVSLEKKQEIIDCLNTAILDEMEDDDFVEYFNREIIPIIVPALIKRFSFGESWTKDIDFDGSIKALLSWDGKELKCIAAMNGYGDAIENDTIIISTKSNP